MEWQEMGLTVLQTVLIIVVPYLTVMIVKGIKLTANKLVEKTQLDISDKYITIAQDTLTNIVIDISENYVKELKKSGQFSLNKQKEAFEMAKERFISISSQEMKTAISMAVIDLDDWLKANIETIVAETK